MYTEQEAIIRVEAVSKVFGKDVVLEDVNLSFYQGKIYGIVGNNGSGKTVLMKCICGFYLPSKGSVYVENKKIGVEVDFPKHIGVIIETPGFLGGLTGRKNLGILANVRHRITKHEIGQVLQRVGLEPNLKKSVSKYSLGMRQRLGIAQAIMEEPNILILDEPFNGLDKHGVAEIRNLLLELKEQGKCILLASHNEKDIQMLCDQVIELDGGEVVNIKEQS